MNKKSVILAIVALLTLTGCEAETEKKKPYVPYSALIPSESSTVERSSTTQSTIETQSSTEIDNETSSTSSVPSNSSKNTSSESSSMDYDAMIEDIASKVAEKIAEQNKNEQTISSSSVVSSSTYQNPIETTSGYTGVAKYPNYTPQSSSSTKQDNSLAIAKIQNQITVCENGIRAYELEIQRLNSVIDECKQNQDNLRNNELAQAKIDLANAKKRTVWVYSDNGGFKQVQDESAVKKAQEKIDYYEGLISDYDGIILKGDGNIAKCNLEISSLKSQIAVYQAEIKELS